MAADIKLYSTEELRKMSVPDRVKLMTGMLEIMAQQTLNIRTGKEKQNHLKKDWQKQVARIQTINTQTLNNQL